MILALILAAAAATAEPAPQTAASPPAAATAPPADAKKPEMICRKEAEMGSRFLKTVCRPKAGYGAMGAEERKAVEAAQHGWSQCGAATNTRC